jgi:hypothetical protein
MPSTKHAIAETSWRGSRCGDTMQLTGQPRRDLLFSLHLSFNVLGVQGALIMSFNTIPLLDLAKADDPVTKPELLHELRHALMEVGFLYIKNTNIELELFDRVKAYGKAIFEIPEAEK